MRQSVETSSMKRRPSPSRGQSPLKERHSTNLKQTNSTLQSIAETVRRPRSVNNADEAEGLPPALCASFLVRRLTEEVQSSTAPSGISRWSEPDDEDLLGPEACMALCAMRLKVEAVLRAAQAMNDSLNGSSSKQGDCVSQLSKLGAALLATIPIVCDEAHCLAETCLSQAVEGLIEAVISVTHKKHVTSASKLPSWCSEASDVQTVRADSSTVTEGVTAYCEALHKAFAVSEPRALRPPPKSLSSKLPSHLRETVVEIDRVVARIRASLSCGGGANWLSPDALLSNIRQELDRLVAQTEAADQSCINHASAAQELRMAVDRTYKAVQLLVTRESASPSPSTPKCPNRKPAASPKRSPSPSVTKKPVTTPRPPRSASTTRTRPCVGPPRLPDDVDAPIPSERSSLGRERSKGNLHPSKGVRFAEVGTPKGPDHPRSVKSAPVTPELVTRVQQWQVTNPIVDTGDVGKEVAVQAGHPQHSDKVAAVVSLKGVLSNWFF